MANSPKVPEEVSVEEAKRLQAAGVPLVDIRSEYERYSGVPAGSVAKTADDIVKDSNAGGHHPDALLICDSGARSLKMTAELRADGCNGFSSVAGGFKAWRTAGLPIDTPQGLSVEQGERYARHLVMPQVGLQGQKKLLASRILLVGLGGLNSPAALYLAAAGVGCLGLVDFDRVERSNLQRQVLHDERSLGQLKAESAKQRLAALNPDVRTEVIELRVDRYNANDLIEHWDIVIDGSDNFETRYALSDACVRHSKPLVYGAVMRFQGQVSVFSGKPCFRCLMPRAPGPGEAPSCSEAGVLGILPGIVGTLQATEALKLALGIGTPSHGKLTLFDALTMEFRQARIQPRPDCPACS